MEGVQRQQWLARIPDIDEEVHVCKIAGKSGLCLLCVVVGAIEEGMWEGTQSLGYQHRNRLDRASTCEDTEYCMYIQAIHASTHPHPHPPTHTHTHTHTLICAINLANMGDTGDVPLRPLVRNRSPPVPRPPLPGLLAPCLAKSYLTSDHNTWELGRVSSDHS